MTQPNADGDQDDAAARDPQSRLSRWLTSHEVERTEQISATEGLLSVGFVYLLGFGLAVLGAVELMTSAHARALANGHHGWSVSFIVELGLGVLATVIAVVLLRRSAPSWARPATAGPWWAAQLAGFGLAFVAIFAGTTATALLRARAYPGGHATGAAWPMLVNSLLAGPMEEIVVLVVPLVFLRAARWPWWAVIGTGLVLRLAYHLYYGYPALGLSVWAIAMMFVYLRTRAIIGMIVAHSYWDVTATVGANWSHVAAGLMLGLAGLAVIVWGIVAFILWLARKADGGSAARAAGAVGWYQSETGHWWWWDGSQWVAPAAPDGAAGSGDGGHGPV